VNAGTLAVTNAVQLAGAININGGILSLSTTSGTNAITSNGAVTIAGGTLQLNAPGNANLIYDSVNVTINTGTFDLNGQSEKIGGLLGGGGTTTNNGTTPATLTVGGFASLVAGDGVTNYGGVISDGTSTLALNQADSNTSTTLTGTNTYSGGTTISRGVVRANNSTSSLGKGTTVVSGSNATSPNFGVMAGTGNTGGPVVVNAFGIITAGSGATTSDSINILDTGTQSWNSGGGYVAKVSGDGSNAGTVADMLVMSASSVNATSGSPFAVTALALGGGVQLQLGTQILIALDSNTSSPTGTNPFTAALQAQTLVLSTNSTVTVPSGDTLSLLASSDGTGDYELFLAATPEPTSLLLAGVAAAPLALGRRRRRAPALGVGRV
jgi:fibronectin-binding autotransporter adhesin